MHFSGTSQSENVGFIDNGEVAEGMTFLDEVKLVAENVGFEGSYVLVGE